MQSFLRNTFAALVVGTLLTGASQAGIIYSQTSPEEPGAAFSSQDTTSGQIIADNFELMGSSHITVRSLRVIGANTGDEVIHNDMDFRIVFFENAMGLPGPIVFGGDFQTKLLTIGNVTGGQLLNGRKTPIEFSIDLGNGVTLSPDTTYWLAIMNDPGPGAGWVWARANGTLDSQIATVSSTSGDLSNLTWLAGSSSGGMWFELSDQVVPEPSSIAIFLVGFCTGCHCWFIGRGSSKTG